MKITCKKYQAVIPVKTCISRIKILKKHKQGSRAFGYGGTQSRKMYEGCEDCIQGLGLYEKYIKGGIAMEDEKVCTKCNQSKSFNLFYKQASSKDGYHQYCKRCHNLYNAARKKKSYVSKKKEKAPASNKTAPKIVKRPNIDIVFTPKAVNRKI